MDDTDFRAPGVNQPGPVAEETRRAVSTARRVLTVEQHRGADTVLLARALLRALGLPEQG
jgi:hypothetical protein